MTPFKVLVCDPPWSFTDKLPRVRGAESHYTCMSIEDLYFLDLPPIADDAILFLWRVSAMPEEALNLAHMWGFTPKAEIVWVKTKKNSLEEPEDENDLAFGMGHYVRGAHETCLIATKGKASKMIKNRSIRSVFWSHRLEHSEKPDKFFRIVEELTDGVGPYCSLFDRKERGPAWHCYGDELGKPLMVNRDASRKTA